MVSVVLTLIARGVLLLPSICVRYQLIVSQGVVDAMRTLPCEVMIKAVVVAVGVEELTVKSGRFF